MRQMQTHRFIQTVFAGALLGCLAAFMPVPAQAQAEPYLEEVVVSFQVRRLLATDMFVQYNGETIFLPVTEIFNLLDLYIESDPDRRGYTGYIISRDRKFKIDLDAGTISNDGRRHEITPADYILGTTDLFLRVDRFQTFFDLPMQFNFSDLRVSLPLNTEFPAYRKLKRSLEHKRLKSERARLGDIKQVPYRRAMLGGAVADWSLSANPIGDGAQYFSLSLGSMLAGGDLNVSSTGNSETGISSDQLTYRWHYFVDTASFVTQVEFGDIFASGSGGPLNRRLRGGVVTNRPQTQRKYFRTVQVEGSPGEGWEVELYIDNRLTDYMITNQTGDYEFNVDVYYGASVLTLKMYGPNGEIRTEDQYIRVPYNLIPGRTLEYSLAAGKTMGDSLNGWYGQGSVFYGISERITAGIMGDVPISSESPEPAAVAGEVTVHPTGNLTLNGSWSPDYLVGFDFNYNQPSLLNIDGSIIGYFDNEYRNRIGQKRSVLFSLSAPMRLKNRRLNLRYYLAWNTFPSNEQITMQYGFNTSFSRVNMFYLGKYQLNRTDGRSLENLFSEIFSSVYLSRWLRPQFRITYDHTNSALSRLSVYLSRRVFKTGQLSFSWERDMQSKTDLFRLTLNLFTGFADFSSRMAYSANTTTINQVQRGSVRYDQEAEQLLFDRYFGVGRSTAVVRPFLDENYNGVRDNDETFVSGLRARVSGGRERPRGGDEQTYYYEGLNPYDEHLVHIDPISLDDPLLKPTWENYRVPLNPNMVTAITVPLVITGEVEGMVRRRTAAGDIGQGGLKVELYNLDKEAATEVTTFSNGDFFYLGLIPGRYRAYIAPDQLGRLGYTTEPKFIEFEMEAVQGGGLVSGLDFVLISIAEPDAAAGAE